VRSTAVKPALSLIVLGLLVLAGCGSSSKSTSSSATTPASTPATTSTSSTSATGGTSAAETLSVAANPEGQLKYDTTSLTTKARTVTINFTNKAPLEHDLTLESSAGSKVGATPIFSGGTKTLRVSLKPGTYKFYCSVPGHRQAGMEGTLTVQ